MNIRQLKILSNTLLALSSGLFTGGVVTSVVFQNNLLNILIKLYFPALVFYYFYILCNVLIENDNLKITNFYVIISIIIAFLFGMHIILF